MQKTPTGFCEVLWQQSTVVDQTFILHSPIENLSPKIFLSYRMVLLRLDQYFTSFSYFDKWQQNTRKE